jgi:hypothetical protein
LTRIGKALRSPTYPTIPHIGSRFFGLVQLK